MGRTKLGNANAQRNNNAKKKNGFNTEFATESYSQMEAAKLISSKNSTKNRNSVARRCFHHFCSCGTISALYDERKFP
ncbi:hypothetical protein FTE28_06230 [Bacillus licheniformis]|nr:hypothetical protein FTE28_06230 [Bacillus licheniformis]